MTEQKIESLCALYGTPLYVFDVPALHARVAQLRRNLPGHVSLCYAVKANPFLVRELCGQVERFEICSPGEAAVCHRLGVPAEAQVISGVYKTSTGCYSIRAARGCSQPSPNGSLRCSGGWRHATMCLSAYCCA